MSPVSEGWSPRENLGAQSRTVISKLDFDRERRATSRHPPLGHVYIAGTLKTKPNVFSRALILTEGRLICLPYKLPRPANRLWHNTEISPQ